MIVASTNGTAAANGGGTGGEGVGKIAKPSTQPRSGFGGSCAVQRAHGGKKGRPCAFTAARREKGRSPAHGRTKRSLPHTAGQKEVSRTRQDSNLRGPKRPARAPAAAPAPPQGQPPSPRKAAKAAAAPPRPVLSNAPVFSRTVVSRRDRLCDAAPSVIRSPSFSSAQPPFQLQTWLTGQFGRNPDSCIRVTQRQL